MNSKMVAMLLHVKFKLKGPSTHNEYIKTILPHPHSNTRPRNEDERFSLMKNGNVNGW